MYYFKSEEQFLPALTVLSKNFDDTTDIKVIIAFKDKPSLSITTPDLEGNVYPIKKNSNLYKNILNALIDKDWSLFMFDDMPIECIVDQEYNEIEPFLAIYPEKRKKFKINPYDQWRELLTNHGLPLIEEENVILKKSFQNTIHIYYRKENAIFHVYINELDYCLIEFEKFNKFI